MELAKDIHLQINTDKIVGNVSPFLFGQFIENMYDCIDPGLHAQLLLSRGFEHPDANGDGVSDPWFPEGCGEYSLDKKHTVAPSYAQRLKNHEDHVNCGVAQDDLMLYENEEYEGSFWVYAEEHASVQVKIASHDQQEVFSAVYAVSPDKWVKHTFRFRSACSQKVKLSLSISQKAEIWLDQVSLMPCSAVCKVWPDVMRYIKDLHPTIIRFPGGCFADCYHWQDGIGNPDDRPARPNVHWGGIEDNGFGTDEFIAMCREIGCEPMICVNFGSGTPEEAANWVEYCNGPVHSKYGALRASNGNPEPYGVKYWDIGNEAFADWEIGHCNAVEYCERFEQFSQAMRKVDPEIKLIACGGDGNSSDQNWNITLSSKIGHLADYLGIHNYTPLTDKKFPDARTQYYAVAGAPCQYEKRMRETAQVIQSNAQNMRLAVTEWNCNYQDSTEQEQTLEAAICNAGMLNTFIRMGELLPIAMISDLVNGWPGGIIRSRYGKCYGTPTYHVMGMYAQVQPRKLVECRYSSPTYSAEAVGNLEKADQIPMVDIVACNTAENKLCLFIVNRNLEDEYTIHLPEEFFATSVSTITSDNFSDRNTWESEKITPKELTGAFKELDVCPCSVSKVYIS